MTDSRLQTICIAFPIFLGGLLYVMGVSYYQGYLYQFGVDNSLFPLAYDKALYFGVIALGRIVLRPLYYILVAGILVAFVLMIVARFASHPKVEHWHAKVKHWRSVVLTKLSTGRATNAPSETIKKFIVKFDNILSKFILGVFLTLFPLFVAAHRSGINGREEVVEDIRSFNDPKGDSNYAILYSPLLSTPTRSKQIICGQSHCAFWLGSKTLVLRHDSIERVEIHNPRVEKMLGDKAAQRPSPTIVAAPCPKS